MKKSKLLESGFILLAVLLFSTSGIAQRKISGVVQDAKTNSPLEGATVSVQNSKTNTISTTGGRFGITIPEGIAVLDVSFVGYETQSVKVNADENYITVKLNQSTANQLSDVVVVGYGTQKKANLTGAVSTVDMDNVLTDRLVTSTAQALQGAAPGLQITTGSGQPGASSSINIRGFTSINGGAPLVLVDNVPMNMDDVNPEDIVKEIFK